MKNKNVGVFFGQTTTLARLCALTDGVYAIVITLLVLDLQAPVAPGLTNVQLLDDLQKQIPNFITYLATFSVVAVFWMRNHWILEPLEKCNAKTFWLNFIHLMFVSITPYTASLIGHYENDPIAVILFSGSLGLASLSLLVLHRYVANKTEWHHEGISRQWTHPNWWMLYPGSLFALVSILLSVLTVNGAVAIWFLGPLWVLLFRRR
ncbi:MAG: TMEM175 family protein [Nitrospirales bacterium]|nr:TMEM175 family protein [Nitrospirales bacterium]